MWRRPTCSISTRRTASGIAAKHFYRPRKPEYAAAEDVARLPKLELFTIDEVFGGWQKAQAVYFADGGVFDQIYAPGK